MGPNSFLRGLFQVLWRSITAAYDIILTELLRLLPDPWTDRFSLFATCGVVIAITAISYRIGHVNLFSAAIALALTVLLWLARKTILSEGKFTRRADFYSYTAFMLINVNVLLINQPGVSGILLVFGTLLLFLWECWLTARQNSLSYIIAPLLIGLLAYDTGILIGAPKSAVFPAVLLFFLLNIVIGTRQLHLAFITEIEPQSESKTINAVRRLNLLAIILFFFGVCSLWPWLGRLYGFTYLWIVILGVLFPISALWGKLKQAEIERFEKMLARFNRIVPYCAILLLAAFVLG